MDKEKIEEILQEFTEYIQSELTSVKENGIERKPTLEDKLDFIKARWEDTSEQLNELGINTDAEKRECKCCGSLKVKATVLGIHLCEMCIENFDKARKIIDKLRG